MSRRLANKARYLKRKRARTGYHPTGVELEGAPPSPDPWRGVPESHRKVVMETLKSGILRKTYVDTAEDHRAPPSKPKTSEAQERAEEPSRSPKVRKHRDEESRFARYSMPGHEKPD